MPTVLAHRCIAWLWAVAAACWLAPAAAWSQPAARHAPADGMFISVPNPIGDVKPIEKKIDDALKKRPQLSIVVFDFNPAGQPAKTSDYGSCYNLAKYIRSLPGKKIATYAYVSNDVSQHTVLPVLACQHLAMSELLDEKTRRPRAALGNISVRLDEEEHNYYRKIARERGLGDLVERMIKPSLELRKMKKTGKDDNAIIYLSPDSISKWRGETLVPQSDFPPDLSVGISSFDARLCRQIGLCEALQDTRARLAANLGLPRKSLFEDWLGDRTPIVWRIEVKGGTDKGNMASLERRVKHAVFARDANFIILQLDVSGGDTTHVASTAKWLSTLKDATDRPVKTVAYVPSGASIGAATFLALGCSEIVMADNSALADFAYLGNASEEDLKPRRKMLTDLAEEQSYPALLFEASLKPDLVLYRAQPRTGSGGELLVTKEQMDEDAAKDDAARQWVNLGPLPRDGKFFKIDAKLAREWGVAQKMDGGSIDALCALYGLDPRSVSVSRDDWLDRVAEFFREPVVRFMLIMLGIIGLILELKMPGTTVPGVLAAICFVLFFWSYSFVGEFTMLAVLLFILGIILLAVEIFVLPGFGFTGITGILLIVCSLALVTLEKWPTTSEEWGNLTMTIGTFGMSLVAAVVAAMAVAWFLPSIPYANRLVLKPPTEEQEHVDPSVPLALLGAIGLASTPLRPAGKAQFGDDFHDVIAEGDFVNPGRRVQVIEIEGNRIVVKEI